MRPAGASPGANVFQVAPVVEVSAPAAGEGAVTGRARMIVGEEAACATGGLPLGERSSFFTGWARSAFNGVDSARATSIGFAGVALRPARIGTGVDSASSGTAGSTLTSASSLGGTVLAGGRPTIGRALLAGARRDR